MRKQPSHPLADDAYVWQRRWNDSLLTALSESASVIRAWRILAAESDANANWIQVPVNRPALRGMAKPVIAVIRIDGRRGRMPLENTLAVQIAAIAANWRKDGAPFRGIEIDYDCATDRLPHYRDFLRSLRARLGRDTALSITALPSWMGSRDLPELLGAVDETVLQLHSVMSPKKGLFDRKVAMQWAQAWSRISPVPFRVALPTYWSRVTWNENGQVVAVESEVARYGTGPVSRELVVEPGEISSLIAALQREPLPHLIGVAWFRLPTAEDGRAWTIRTWHAVMNGKPLPPAPVTVRFKSDGTGTRDVYLLNGSGLDAKLPAEVSVSAQGCEWADALPPYTLERDAATIRFRLVADNLLRAGREQPVGWVRCSDKNIEGHASF